MELYGACHLAMREHMERAPPPVKRMVDCVRRVSDAVLLQTTQWTARLPGKWLVTFVQVLLLAGLLGLYVMPLVSSGDVETIQLNEAAEDERGAMCLDGSAPVVHFSPGVNRRKWAIHHEGGDWCNLEFAPKEWRAAAAHPTNDTVSHTHDKAPYRDSWACPTRAQSDLGSSK